MRSLIYAFAFLLGFQQYYSHAEGIELTQTAIDHEGLIPYNFENGQYDLYQQAFEDTLISFFKNFKGGQEIKIVQSFDPEMDPYFAFSAKPILADSVRHALQKKLMNLTPLKSKYLPFSAAYTIVINGGHLARGVDFLPQLENPRQVQQNRYALANLTENYTLVQQWIREGAMPLFMEILFEHPERLKSISGETVIFPKDAKTAAKSVIEMKNFDSFYRNSLANFGDNPQLLVMLKTFRYAAEGKFAYSQLYAAMVYNFENRNSLINYILEEFIWRLAYYYRLEGILLTQVANAENERVKNQLIDSVLIVNPMSSEALYASIDPTQNHLVSTYRRDRWAQFERSNPMHTETRKPASKIEAYHNYLRESSYDLFIDPETISHAHEQFAELALELGEYDFGADLYWMLSCANTTEKNSEFQMGSPLKTTEEKEKNREKYLLYFHYAYYQLGMTKAIDKKTKKTFKQITKTFERKMKQSSAYKDFN